VTDFNNDYTYLPRDPVLIKRLVDEGKQVFVDSRAYYVIKDSIGQYLIKCWVNNSYIGLTWRNGTTLNGSTFFTCNDPVFTNQST
jgi:hypothetical protein